MSYKNTEPPSLAPRPLRTQEKVSENIHDPKPPDINDTDQEYSHPGLAYRTAANDPINEEQILEKYKYATKILAIISIVDAAIQGLSSLILFLLRINRDGERLLTWLLIFILLSALPRIITFYRCIKFSTCDHPLVYIDLTIILLIYELSLLCYTSDFVHPIFILMYCIWVATAALYIATYFVVRIFINKREEYELFEGEKGNTKLSRISYLPYDVEEYLAYQEDEAEKEKLHEEEQLRKKETIKHRQSLSPGHKTPSSPAPN